MVVLGGPGGGFRTGRSSGKPLLLPVLKKTPPGPPKPLPGPRKLQPGQLEMSLLQTPKVNSCDIFFLGTSFFVVGF